MSGGRAAFYGLVDIPGGAENALAFAKRLLIERGVAVVPGDTFGAATARMCVSRPTT